MGPDRVLNPGPLTYEPGALPTVLHGPALLQEVSNQPLHYLPFCSIFITIMVIILCVPSLTLKVPNKNCSSRHFNFYFYLSKKIRLDFSCESSASRGFT